MKHNNKKKKGAYNNEYRRHNPGLILRTIHYSNIILEQPLFLLDNGIEEHIILETARGTRQKKPLHHETIV